MKKDLYYHETVVNSKVLASTNSDYNTINLEANFLNKLKKNHIWTLTNVFQNSSWSKEIIVKIRKKFRTEWQ